MAASLEKKATLTFNVFTEVKAKSIKHLSVQVSH